jgi:serine/threonine protein kinase
MAHAIGTPGHMAPELLVAPGPIVYSQAIDIYNIGLILTELLMQRVRQGQQQLTYHPNSLSPSSHH